MTELRVGVDIVELTEVAESLAHFGDRYLQRVFSNAELSSVGDFSAREAAARFATKEAAMKVIGDGEPLDWRSIEVISGPEGSQLHLSGRAATSAQRLGVCEWSITTSVTDRHVLAVVLAAVES